MHKIMSQLLVDQLTGDLTWLEGVYEEEQEES